MAAECSASSTHTKRSEAVVATPHSAYNMAESANVGGIGDGHVTGAPSVSSVGRPRDSGRLVDLGSYRLRAIPQARRAEDSSSWSALEQTYLLLGNY